jgi:anti-sigma-K factor RskA
MSTENRCFCDLAPLYVLDCLSEADRAWVEAQIAENPELAVEIATLEETVATLAHAAPIAPMEAQLKQRLFQSLALPAANVVPLPLNRVRQSHWPARRWVGAAVAAVALVALTVDNLRLRQTNQTTQQQLATLQQATQVAQQQVATLQQLDTAIYTLKGTENAPRSLGRLIVNPTQQTATIVTQQLPTLPAGKAYRLWAMPVGATTPLYCGEFQPATAHLTTQWTLPAPACGQNVAQMLISTESQTAPLQPAGPLVMKSLI